MLAAMLRTPHLTPQLVLRIAACVICLALSVAPVANARTVAGLLAEGTRLGLTGDYAGAYIVASELRELDPDGTTGQAFHLNTLLTQLSWDGRATEYDVALRETADNILAICEVRIKTDPADAMAQYHCGLANFSLAFLNALRDRHYAAGLNGTRSIRHFESALALQPELIEPRMQLGMAYFYADNLPPYIKLFSRLLWFIPSGHSDKSLPYIRSVMESDSYLRDVARFVYSDLAREGDKEDVETARVLLKELVQRYPRNSRLQLGYTSLLVEQQDFGAAISVTERAIETQHFLPDEEAMLQLWRVRARLGAGEEALAIRVVNEMPEISPAFPTWARAWLLVTEAQMLDLGSEREKALAKYREVLQLEFVGDTVLEAANRGLREPFSAP